MRRIRLILSRLSVVISPSVMGAVIGSGIALALVVWLFYAGARSYSPIPPPLQQAVSWNETAIKANFNNIETDRDQIIFTYVLENETDFDYQLTERSMIVFGERIRDQTSSAPTSTADLPVAITQKNESIVDNLPLFIPSRQGVLFTIKTFNPHGFPTKTMAGRKLKGNAKRAALEDYRRKLTEYLRNETSLNGFVLFDYSKHYRIEFLNAWQQP